MPGFRWKKPERMARKGVTFTWVPDPIVHAQAMERAAVSMASTRAPIAAASDVLLDDIAERFETETDPSGAKWKDWARSYVAQAKAYPNIGILRQTGALAEAASSSHAVLVTEDTVFYKTDALPHAGLAHEIGIEQNRGRGGPLPRRSFLGLDEEGSAIVFELFEEWFESNLQLYVTSLGRVRTRHILQDSEGLFTSRESMGLDPL